VTCTPASSWAGCIIATSRPRSRPPTASSNDPVISLTVGDTQIRIEGKKASITVGEAELVVDGNSPGELSLTAGDAKATFKGNGELSLEASQKLLLKGNQVEIKGDAGVTISGAKVDLN
jgi:hypothetical protein